MYIDITVCIPITTMSDERLHILAKEINDELKRRTPPAIELTKAEKALAAAGCTIEAIKMVRERVGREQAGARPGLRQCKDSIDAYRESIGWVRNRDGILEAP